MSSDTLVMNGVDGVTGDYLVPPKSASEMVELLIAERQQVEPVTLKALQRLHNVATRPTYGVPFDVDPRRVEEAGWGIVFHADEDPAVRDAFKRLIEHRTAKSKDGLVKVLAYSGQSASDWLHQHGVALGSVRPDRVPLYLLLVGSPSRIPFEFGYLLDVEYAVGRLHFASPDQYAAYVDSLIDYERGATVPNGRRVAFFGPQHEADQATRLSAERLVKPLALGTSDAPALVQRITQTAYRADYYPPERATKDALHRLFHTPATEPTPAVIFTASHGVGWPVDDPRQAASQGALVCQEFDGPGTGPPQPAHYFAASDLEPGARVHGMVCFHFACFGAGTPQQDRFFQRPGTPRPIAPAAAFSPLPKALLSHPNGSALGVIGHVDRAWACSFTTSAAGSQLLPFENTLGYLLSGNPLGYCLKDFNSRYAALSTTLAALLDQRRFKVAVPEEDLWRQWTERNDAEAYVLLGDPAARLRPDALLD